MEYLSDIPGALRDLLVAFFAYIAFKLARDSYLSRWAIVWRGFLWCAGIALFAAVTMGNPTCEVPGDPLFGMCEQYADGGYQASTTQQAQRFFYVLTLLWLPVLFGAASERQRLKGIWRKLKGQSAEVASAGPKRAD